MNEFVPFILAVLALLAVPGPTNTLMAAAGASRGLVRSLPFLAGELGGYLIAITFWTEVVGAVATSQPMVPVIAKFIAAAFLVWSGWKLWSAAGRVDLKQRGITLSRVFATTLINPKGLVFAFAIFPQVGFGARVPYLGCVRGFGGGYGDRVDELGDGSGEVVAGVVDVGAGGASDLCGPGGVCGAVGGADGGGDVGALSARPRGSRLARARTSP
ncbi:MAG: LysE type translocator [Devosia sp.]|uniref:LysE family translocator n=1 Tax=Devosia sp. TaxID=1871048 RepID=UPI00261A8F08|nr:LysE family transporter [Devosia sp.]MDB5585205.1 LysE type translocator [Devosia sp.]